MKIEDLIRHLEIGEAPEKRVVIEGEDSEGNSIRFEPMSVRWDLDAVVIEADYES